MKKYREKLHSIVIHEIQTLLAKEGASEETANNEPWQQSIIIERPPKVALGDAAVPLFALARILKASPAAIAERLKSHIESHMKAQQVHDCDCIDHIEVKGPYLNFFFTRSSLGAEIIQTITEQSKHILKPYGSNTSLSGETVVIEFSSPNTNKPLHLGHLRNNVLGESLRRMLIACGAAVVSINLINDRGIHTCKAMLSYKNDNDDDAQNGKTPQEAGIKSDHFVGAYYVAFEQAAKANPKLLDDAQEMLRQWESGDKKTLELWNTMRSWALEGIQETYKRTAIHFDNYDFESETYLAGKEQVYKGLEQGVFYRKDDGAIAVDLSDEGLDEKVLLRADGTTLYVTQDIGTAIRRFESYTFDRHIYIVANEQIYHFQVLFHILRRLKYPWADRMYHRSYGMVQLPEGKMKSREGTVVDADNLLDELSQMAYVPIKEKHEKQGNEDPEALKALADAIALGALHYYLLSPNPTSDIRFDPKKSLSFTGSTGPYLQYTLTRIQSIRSKANDVGIAAELQGELITSDGEWELICQLAEYPDIVARAADQYDPSILSTHLLDIAQCFSTYYHEEQIVMADKRELSAARLALVLSVGQVLHNGLNLLVIPAVDRM